MDNLNETLKEYQKAVEYFSAIGDSQYDSLLEKMHMILTSDQVVKFLQNEEDKKNRVRMVSGLQVITEELEDH